MKWILVAALLLAASTTPARADISRYTCELYFADTEVSPPEAREILKPDSRTALKVCSAWDDEGSRTFARVFASLRHPFDVCQIVERQLLKDKGTWTYTPDRKSVRTGKSGSVRVCYGGSGTIKKKNNKATKTDRTP